MTIEVPVKWQEVDARDRRLIIVAYPQNSEDLKSEVDWKKVVAGTLPLGSGLAGAAGVAGAASVALTVGLPFLAAPALAAAGWKAWLRWHAARQKRAILPYPVLDPVTARSVFTFPIGHPVEGLVYACSEADPLRYVPLAGFHRYMYEAKMAAFHELCAALGARRCTVVHEGSDDRKWNGKAEFSGTPLNANPVSAGVDASKHLKSEEAAKTLYEYPKPVAPPHEVNSGWVVGEPSWGSMQRLRLTRDLKHFHGEFSYADDMGVDAEVAAKISGIGLKIGGSFEGVLRRKWEFDVEFWPQVASTEA
jgi:hypothetical protein